MENYYTQYGPDTIDTIKISDPLTIKVGLEELPKKIDALSKKNEDFAYLKVNTEIGQAFLPTIPRLVEGGKWQADQLVDFVDRRLRKYGRDKRDKIAYEHIYRDLSGFIVAIIVDNVDDASFVGNLWAQKIERITEDRAASEARKRLVAEEKAKQQRLEEERRQRQAEEALRRKLGQLGSSNGKNKYNVPNQRTLSANQARRARGDESSDMSEPHKKMSRRSKKAAAKASLMPEPGQKDNQENSSSAIHKPVGRKVKSLGGKKTAGKSKIAKDSQHKFSASNSFSRATKVISKKVGPKRGSGDRRYKYQSSLSFNNR